eukprot:1148103-Pelagomonas_calceolata.AAC.4
MDNALCPQQFVRACECLHHLPPECTVSGRKLFTFLTPPSPLSAQCEETFAWGSLKSTPSIHIGSAYIYGFCDKFWRPDMSEAEAKEFVVRALSHAMARDASSGGCIRTVSTAPADVLLCAMKFVVQPQAV